MTTKSEVLHDAGFLIAEADAEISRDPATVTVAANTTLKAGTVLGQISATGKYVEYDNAESDGREEAAGVLLAALTNDDDAEADLDGTIVNFCAAVRSADLTWKTGLTDNDKTAGLADLKALGIKAR